MHVRALAGGDVNAHAGAAEQQRTLVFPFGNFRAYPQAHPVEHVFRVVVVGALVAAQILNFPALGPQMGADGLLQGIAGEIRADDQLFILYRFP